MKRLPLFPLALIVAGLALLVARQLAWATGALSFMHMRVALGVEYPLGDQVVLMAQPVVLSWSPANRLRDEVDAIARYEILVGAGYKL